MAFKTSLNRDGAGAIIYKRQIRILLPEDPEGGNHLQNTNAGEKLEMKIGVK